MAFEISRNEGSVKTQDLQLFLKGAPQSDQSKRVPNPAKNWISAHTWGEIQNLENYQSFNGIIESLTREIEAWEKWFRCLQPEIEPLPADWSKDCDPLNKMILVKCFR